jgi:hypothetical protein
MLKFSTRNKELSRDGKAVDSHGQLNILSLFAPTRRIISGTQFAEWPQDLERREESHKKIALPLLR